MYAVVATGGKQLKVAQGDVIVCEKLENEVGETVSFQVLFAADGDEVAIDSGALESCTVTGEIVEHFLGDKVLIFKFKKRKGYKRLRGHRQMLTRVKISDVTMGGTKPKKAAAKAKDVEAAEPKKRAPRKKVVEAAEAPVVEAVIVEEAVEAPVVDTAETSADE